MGVIKAQSTIVRKNSTGSDFQRRRVNLIEGSNVTLTVSDDSANNEIDVTIASSGGSGMAWTEVTGTSQSAAVNNGYIANNAGLVTVTIPTTAAVGDIVRVVGKGAGLFKIAQNASEIIHFGNATTTTGTGGSLTATHRYDAIDLICIVANTEWNVISSIGNFTIT